MRAAGLLLPPADPDVDVSWFCCPYPELQTPAARELTFPPNRPALVRGGVELVVGFRQQRLIRLPASPYALLHRGRKRAQPCPFTRMGGEIRVEVDGRPGVVTVLEAYFPGWQVLTPNGWREVEPGHKGLLRAPVAAGQTELRFRFQRWTRPRTAGWLLTGLTALGLTVLWAWRPRRREAPPPDHG
jgi:hypothetical protein